MLAAPIFVIIVTVTDIVSMKRHTIGKIVDPHGYTWYARDDHTLYHADMVNTHIVYSEEGGLRRREFHIFNPAVIDESATASQADVWKQFFGS
jgi:hypothetical protein